MGKKVSVAEYARHRGVSRQAVYKALKDGRISRTDDGRIDLEAADQDWERNTAGTSNHDPPPAKRKARPRPRKKSTSLHHSGASSSERAGASREDVDADDDSELIPDLSTARAVKEHYLSQLRKLEYRIKSGQVVETSVAAREQFRASRLARDRVLAVADRLADELAAEMDPAAVHRLLLQELRRALESAAEATLSGEEVEAA